MTGFDAAGGPHRRRRRCGTTAAASALTIRAGTVINAGGVFAGRIEALAGGESQVQIKPAKGVAPDRAPRRAAASGDDAMVLPETEDGRLLFLVPWGPRVTIGTTDTPGGDMDRPVADAEDVAYLLRHVNRYMTLPADRGRHHQHLGRLSSAGQRDRRRRGVLQALAHPCRAGRPRRHGDDCRRQADHLPAHGPGYDGPRQQARWATR